MFCYQQLDVGDGGGGKDEGGKNSGCEVVPTWSVVVLAAGALVCATCPSNLGTEGGGGGKGTV